MNEMAMIADNILFRCHIRMKSYNKINASHECELN